MNEILYDTYDKDENPIGIIFAKDCNDLLNKNPNVKYVRGMDIITRKPNWFEVKNNGLHSYSPKLEAHKKEIEIWRSISP